jgi:hypothetical protein
VHDYDKGVLSANNGRASASAFERRRIDRATLVLEMPLADLLITCCVRPLTKEIGEQQRQTSASAASASFRTRDEKKMRRLIDESGPRTADERGLGGRIGRDFASRPMIGGIWRPLITGT